jgi:hypothetical protein
MIRQIKRSPCMRQAVATVILGAGLDVAGYSHNWHKAKGHSWNKSLYIHTNLFWPYRFSIFSAICDNSVLVQAYILLVYSKSQKRWYIAYFIEIRFMLSSKFLQHEDVKIKVYTAFLINYRCNILNEMFMLYTNLHFLCTLVQWDWSIVGGGLAGVC